MLKTVTYATHAFTNALSRLRARPAKRRGLRDDDARLDCLAERTEGEWGLRNCACSGWNEDGRPVGGAAGDVLDIVDDDALSSAEVVVVVGKEEGKKRLRSLQFV